MQNTIRGLLVFFIATAIGLAIAWAVGMESAQYAGFSVPFICGIIAYVVNWLVFIPAEMAKSEKFYDLTGAITYLSVVTVACLLSGSLDARAMTAAALVIIWCVRLGTFLFARISRDGHDRRFDKIKPNTLRFLGAWTIQGLWVILTALCAIVMITTTTPKPIGVFFWAGLAVWVLGFVFEVVADHQKQVFRKDPANKEAFIQSGLWAWSRHPNYFGEITLWTGMAIIALPVLAGLQWLALISPVFVALLLTKISGVPLLERHGMKKWGDDPAYQDYVRRTPVLIPRPPSK